MPTGVVMNGPTWTGAEMIVWGGWDDTFMLMNSGGRYDPSTDSWAPTSLGGRRPNTTVQFSCLDGHGGDRLGRGGEYRRAVQPGDRHVDADVKWRECPIGRKPCRLDGHRDDRAKDPQRGKFRWSSTTLSRTPGDRCRRRTLRSRSAPPSGQVRS
jgi:hypothetical protein